MCKGTAIMDDRRRKIIRATCTIWNQRNKVRLNLQTSPLHQVVAQPAEMLAQFRANTEASGMQVRSNRTRHYNKMYF